MLNILAIDPGTKLGWATLINGQIESGVQDFSLKRGESQGMKFIRFNDWLWYMSINDVVNCKSNLNLIVYEQTYMRYGKALDVLVGMTTRIEEHCTYYNIQYTSVNVGTLKKTTVGNGKASKEDIMKWFKKKVGRDPIDDNEADARALLEYAIQEFIPTNQTQS